jgi:transglutaminase-like putative cysteine protease
LNAATGLLVFVALLSLQLSRHSHSSLAGNLFAAAAMLVASLGVRVALSRLHQHIAILRFKHIGLALAACLGAVVAVLIKAGAVTASNEELVLAVLMSVAVGLWLSDRDGALAGTVASISVLVALFATTSADQKHRLLIIMLATLAGVFWLVASKYALARWALLYAIAAGAVVAGSTLLAHQVIQPTDGNPSFAAWVPTSGGDDAGDDNARRGKGDGPDEVAGQSPDFVGFDRSDNFSESGKDGLYDIWMESYGAPFEPGELQKMIGLRPDQLQMVQAPDRENLKVGRSFDMRRQPRPERKATTRAESAATAAVWIKGPLPAYVPLASFVEFDGNAWRAIEHGKPFVPVRRLGETFWMEILHRPISPAFSGTNTYEVRIGTLGGDVLPLPPIVERFKMGRVDRPQFFASSRSGAVRLATRKLPPGVSLDVVCKRVDADRLVDVEPALPKNSDVATLSLNSVDPRVARLATEWATDQPRGWRQIEQVISRLRQHVEHDAASVVHTSGDPIAQLLFDRRRGTDYQIASAGVFILRSLGYSTRLTSGLFVDETTLDRSSGFASATAENAHFWIEVMLADGTWVTVDPTPGYPLLDLPKPVGDRLAELWNGAIGFVHDRWAALTLAIGSLGAMFFVRRRCFDAILTTACRLRGYRTIDVLRVLQFRARSGGAPRPSHVPVGTWLNSIPAFEHRDALIRAVNTKLYGDDSNRIEKMPCGAAVLRACTSRVMTATKEHHR